MVTATRHKPCSKSYTALFLLNIHLRLFYSLVIYCHYPLPASINPQLYHKLIGPHNITPLPSIPFTPPHYSTMSGRTQIHCPPPHVEDEMEQDTTQDQLELFVVHCLWQQTQMSGLLEHRNPPTTTTTTSTQSNPNTVIGGTSILFRSPVGTYKGNWPQRTQTTTASISTSMQQQLARLQAEKVAALGHV